MRKNNEPEARALAYKQVPHCDAEDVVGAVIARLTDSLDSLDGGTFDACESELDGVVENLRDALVGAIEERLDLRDAIMHLDELSYDLEFAADRNEPTVTQVDRLVYAIRNLVKAVGG